MMMSDIPQKLTEIKTLPGTLGRVAEYDLTKEIPWFGFEVFHNPLGAYLVAAVTFVVYWAVLFAIRHYTISRCERLAASRPNSMWQFSLDLANQIKSYILPLVALYLAMQPLTLNPALERVLKLLTAGLVTLQVVRLAGELAGILIAYSRGGFAVRDPVVRNTSNNITTLAKVAIWVAGGLFFLDNAGFNVSTFIAGLGIGGVAIALAAQAILGDTFSSFAISLDKPFEAGDYITVDSMQGTVEHIGLKTTRVRSVSGELLVFANSDLTKSRIRNFKRIERRRNESKLYVHPQTKISLIKEIPDIVAKIISSHDNTEIDVVKFAGIEKAALTFDVAYYMKTPDYAVFTETRQSINFAILDAFAAKGIVMAFDYTVPATFAGS